MLKHVELYFLDVIKGKRVGLFARFLRLVLRLLSWCYRLYVTCRNWAFDRGCLRKYSPPVPVVISVGNIVVGGTGKTPVTLMLAQEFYEEVPIAILTRGYRSKVESLAVPIVLSCGQGPMHLASYCGDEPFMLAQNFPKAFVYVGRDRHQASNMAAKAGARLILLDDGMQHRRLARDLEVVVMDACDPFGQGFFLPRGLLRDSTASLKRADLIILNHIHDPDRLHNMRQQLAKWSQAPLVATRLEVVQILDLHDLPVPSIRDRRVGIFCGIAHPDYFENTVGNQGAHVVARRFVADHAEEGLQALIAFARHCVLQGAEMLVCTEKDRVKLAGSLDLPLPVVWLKMKLVIVEGEAEWQAFIARARHALATRL